MDITNEELPWSSEDIDLWAQFLRSTTGSRLIPKLLEGVPPLFEDGETNRILIRSGLVKGVQLTAQNLLALAEHPKKESTPAMAYPPLESDDEKHWDGPKLKDNQPT